MSGASVWGPGTVTIISNQILATMAALKALANPGVANEGVVVNVLGYNATHDKGGGSFTWNSTSVAADDGGTIIAPNAGGTGRWIRFPTGPLNVFNFGAYGDYPTHDDSAAFTLAQAAALYIEVPAGFSYKVDNTLNYWQFYGAGTVIEPTRIWKLCPFRQNGAPVKSYNALTYGAYEQQVAASFTINNPYSPAQSRLNTQATGTDAHGLATTSNNERGAVTMFLGVFPRVPIMLTGATTVFTATSVTHANISTTNTLPGMWIDIFNGAILTDPVAGHSDWVGQVKSVAGTTATVDAWYVWSTGATATPANGKLGLVNYNSKVWGTNIVLDTTNLGTGPRSNAAGVEINFLQGGTVGTPKVPGDVSGTWGIDLYALPYQAYDVGVYARGRRNISFYSSSANGIADISFSSTGCSLGFGSVSDSIGVSIVTPNLGLYIQDAVTNNIEVKVSGSDRFSVDNAGVTRFISPVISQTVSPASGAAGIAGALAWDAGYIYVCTASGAWKRAALTGGY